MVQGNLEYVTSTLFARLGLNGVHPYPSGSDLLSPVYPAPKPSQVISPLPET
jgi:hypothetical protein